MCVFCWPDSVQLSRSVVSDSLRPHELQHTRPPCPSPTPGVHPNHLILRRPLVLLPSIFPSISVFSNESALRIRRPKYWSFIFNISPSNEHPGLISFRIDWLDLLAVLGGWLLAAAEESKKSSWRTNWNKRNNFPGKNNVYPFIA